MRKGLFKVRKQSTNITGFNGYDKGANYVSVCPGGSRAFSRRLSLRPSRPAKRLNFVTWPKNHSALSPISPKLARPKKHEGTYYDSYHEAICQPLIPIYSALGRSHMSLPLPRSASLDNELPHTSSVWNVPLLPGKGAGQTCLRWKGPQSCERPSVTRRGELLLRP
ncbi:hypothetical protein O988_00375 [Pseudogymnoascus sp. VKM F-3808]|nr:hypothetical protein O988_00375 [Pseudogymnoascus sp. VKM F-3808]